jgi:molybdopterin biosynthesis enzyme
MQLVAAPVIERIGGLSADEPIPRQRAELAEDLPGAPGWLRLVHACLDGGVVRPIFARPSRLSAMAAADGFLRVPEAGLRAGEMVEVDLYR